MVATETMGWILIHCNNDYQGQQGAFSFPVHLFENLQCYENYVWFARCHGPIAQIVLGVDSTRSTAFVHEKLMAPHRTILEFNGLIMLWSSISNNTSTAQKAAELLKLVCKQIDNISQKPTKLKKICLRLDG